ncbi:MAG TPA: 5-(carboxyamino)imidazole ribonucleotide synthase [Gemmatimonadales bacterium]|nr:5-(carboxyamino)imidazole ribonucleotide synthase [Gemmatimonadales bacterium]
MILPGATVGMLGGGQLGRMFTLRARSMGYGVVVLDPDPLSPAGLVADRHLRAAYTDEAALDELAASCAAITTEFENVPAAALERLARTSIVRPPVGAVAIAQDRIAEKRFLHEAGFATARFRAVHSAADLEGAVGAIRLPGLLKTSRLGYDGKGQATVTDLPTGRAAFERFGGVACVLEERLALETELSVVLARGDDGAVAAFPVGENHHRDGILETTVVPARVPERLAEEARALAIAVAERMAYVGVLGVELFVANGGRLFVNEMAPRPHNSGHYTMDACAVDQFEQQLRALCGLPLGEPRLLTPVAMINLLGDLWAGGEPRWAEALRRPGVRLHLYGKAEPRPGRKMGHLNCLARDPGQALALALAARAALLPAPAPVTT